LEVKDVEEVGDLEEEAAAGGSERERKKRGEVDSLQLTRSSSSGQAAGGTERERRGSPPQRYRGALREGEESEGVGRWGVDGSPSIIVQE
jgi:hypothetical protein